MIDTHYRSNSFRILMKRVMGVDVDNLVSSVKAAEADVQEKEVITIIENMPESHREVIRALVEDGWRSAARAVSRALGITLSAAAKRVTKSRDAFERELKRKGVIE